MCTVEINLADLQILGISARGNAVCHVKVLNRTVLLSRKSINTILQGNTLKGMFKEVEGYDLPMFFELVFKF
jgi:hypothetical protein